MKKECLSGNDVEVSLERDTVVRLADHEILLSFTNDIGAVAFDRWWHEIGHAQFEKWSAKQPKDELN